MISQHISSSLTLHSRGAMQILTHDSHLVFCGSIKLTNERLNSSNVEKQKDLTDSSNTNTITSFVPETDQNCQC
jgi:hypothetical protein